jgi:hypothetical protein
MGIWNQWRIQQNWNFIEGTAKAQGWREVPDDLRPLWAAASGAAGKGYLIRRDERAAILVGFNTDDNAVSVAMSGEAKVEAVIKLLGEILRLKDLGTQADLGQESRFFAAALPGERVGMVLVTAGTSSLTKGVVSVGIVDWRTSLRLTPQLEQTFSELERRDPAGK